MRRAAARLYGGDARDEDGAAGLEHGQFTAEEIDGLFDADAREDRG